jgi:hypothetical protein
MEKAEKITISMYPSLWLAFRMACLQRKTPASRELQRLIEQQLAAWQHQTQKDPDHA